MSHKYRLVLLGFSFAALSILGYMIRGDFSVLLGEFWFTSGLLLLVLLSLIDQPHFSKDSNIFVNVVTATISLLIVPKIQRDPIFWVFAILCSYLLISSYALMWIRTRSLKEEGTATQLISRLNRVIGRPESLFSAFFLWGGVKQFGMNGSEFNSLLWYWIIFTILNIPALASTIEGLITDASLKKSSSAIGKIFGVQSKNTFLVKLNDEKRESIRLFTFVEFKYSIDDIVRRGMILDVFLLNEAQWVKIMCSSGIDEIFKSIPEQPSLANDLVYLMQEIPTNDFLDRFVGLITENSTIEKIRLIYGSKSSIFEGSLLELKVQGSTVMYQVVQGSTRIELLENKNQASMIIVDAIQLGTWSVEKCRFEQFGWVPQINTPVFTATSIYQTEPSIREYTLGFVPSTNYPVVINTEIAVTHHTAILGVTGSGKSVFARNLIRRITQDSTKVIIVDLTGEYKDKFPGIETIITPANSAKVFSSIESLANEEKKFPRDRNQEHIKEYEKIIKKELHDAIKSFLSSDKTESLFEIPEISNNSEVIDYTKWFFWVLFNTAKTQTGTRKRVCVVLEEAHTIIPELNSMGTSDFASKATVNSIAQIALQGRKYNIGFIVIAQRTANVSKTVLTQCNSIIAFQELDRTSCEFLSNYLGQDYIAALPTLKFRQAIAVGKAFKSTVPMIFEVPELDT